MSARVAVACDKIAKGFDVQASDVPATYRVLELRKCGGGAARAGG